MHHDASRRSEIAAKLDFVGMGKAQLASLTARKAQVENLIGPALDRFYAQATSNPETARHFNDASHVGHAKQKQVEHWRTIMTGKFDQAYIDGVTRIGKVHARLGLEPQWYIGGYSLVLEEMIKGLITTELGGFGARRKAAETAEGVAALVKAALIDMDYSITVYLDVLTEEREKAEQEQLRLKAEQDKALQALEQALHGLAAGDLGSTISEPLSADFDQLKANYNASVAKLSEAFGEIITSIRQSESDTRELSGATDDMAKRTEQQAAALEETAAAVEEISVISKQSEERVREARQVVEAASEQAALSGETVSDAISAMGKIEESSKKITQIITVIDEISFQTNLLALNAGVEAARAGEAGRGFAVVAQEVRELAQRSAAAAKEIKDLIDASFDDVLRGVSLVNKTGDTLSSIGDQVRVISEHFGLISMAAQEQATGISEINTAIGSMDQITQQNAAMVEQTNAATQNLLGINQTLGQLVSRFSVSGQSNQVMQQPRYTRAA
ncbi:globin-coupled sensor protein [Hoeflea sp. AS16]|uniref:globin-coupled sensor protein n=1 Tax=unclassified Hoeflea TaxID=2614931 RepID=UPI00317CFB61